MGNPGRRPIPESIQPKGTISAPKQLSTAARVIWRQVVGAMPEGTYAATDAMGLATLCEAVADYWIAAKKTEEEGRYVKGSTGQLVIAPWVKDKADQARLIYTWSQRLYLDPVARAQLMVPPSDDADDDFGGLIQ